MLFFYIFTRVISLIAGKLVPIPYKSNGNNKKIENNFPKFSTTKSEDNFTAKKFKNCYSIKILSRL